MNNINYSRRPANMKNEKKNPQVKTSMISEGGYHGAYSRRNSNN
jgi:hypothetical protein